MPCGGRSRTTGSDQGRARAPSGAILGPVGRCSVGHRCREDRAAGVPGLLLARRRPSRNSQSVRCGKRSGAASSFRGRVRYAHQGWPRQAAIHFSTAAAAPRRGTAYLPTSKAGTTRRACIRVWATNHRRNLNVIASPIQKQLTMQMNNAFKTANPLG